MLTHCQCTVLPSIYCRYSILLQLSAQLLGKYSSPRLLKYQDLWYDLSHAKSCDLSSSAMKMSIIQTPGCPSLPGAIPDRSCTQGPVQPAVQGGSTLLTHYFRDIKCTALGGNKSNSDSCGSFLISVLLLSRTILHILGCNTGRICLKTIQMQNLRLHGSIILYDLLSGFCQALHCHQHNIW